MKLIENKQLMQEWDWNKNQELGFDPNEISAGSGKKAWWRCSKGHKWNAVISSRNQGSGCPYCSGRFAIEGVNDLKTTFPDVAKEWDFEKNKESPNAITSRSKRKVWWICKNGHSYQCTVSHRIDGNGCPYCSNHKVLVGYNDLATTNPELTLEWNYDKNTSLFPTGVTAGSGKKVWWKCKYGHEWNAIISSRNKGTGCPVCRNKATRAGVNDLETINPTLIDEWNYGKNGNLFPSMVTPSSGKKVWWICSRGHEWEATIDHRSKGRGCPICLTDRRSSFPEQAIFFYILKIYANSKNRYMLNQRYELDVFIPELNVAIEYDGVYFHASEKSIKNEKIKNDECFKQKILLIRVKEDKKGIEPYVQRMNEYLISIVYTPETDYKNLQLILEMLISLLKEKDEGISLNVDLGRDRLEILSLLKQSDVKDNIEEKRPDIAAEWNYDKNGMLCPSSFAWASNRRMWWTCPNGHEYQTKISNRTVLNRGCPICAIQDRAETRHKNSVERNNFQKWCYENGKEFLLEEWDLEANDNKTPNCYSTGSIQSVGWSCHVCGYKWRASISNRAKGTGCPSCYKLRREKEKHSKPVTGDNAFVAWCLKNNREVLLSEWNKEKNRYPATNYTYGSNEKVWWKCSNCNEEWQATIKSRKMGRGCPHCAKQNIKNLKK